MDLKLQDKTALVTGSTAGIGFAIATLLAQEGVTVIINGRTQQRVFEAINKIKAVCPTATLLPIAADLTTVEGTEKLIAEFPTVDILVNNLGIYQVKAFNDITDEEWLHLFNANVMSGVRLSRHYLPQMCKQNWGRIIFISSESAVQIPMEMIHYGMTKTAQLAIARGLAEMTAGTNVTVNSVLPGPTLTEGVNYYIEHISKERNIGLETIEKEFFNTLRPTSILKRFATPEEVASLAVFLCSPLSAGTNGAALRVDGGTVKSII